ncbi:MAG: ankyrin repeat domain-containing protein, partial [Gammaproteobacteria bacterium]
RQGVNPNQRTESGVTPLLVATGFYELYEDRRKAVKKRDQKLDCFIKLLIDAGATIDLAADCWPVKGYTPLIFAIMLYPYNISTLIDAGANVNHRTHDGSTPLIFGASSRHSTMTLLKAGADATAINDKGCGVLHFAKTVELGKLLKKAGANIYQADMSGCTPLLQCAQTGNIGLFKWLASHPDALKATTVSGRTAMDIAKNSEHGDICQWLAKQ